MLRVWARHWFAIIVLQAALLVLADAWLVEAAHSGHKGWEDFFGASMWVLIGGCIVTILVRASQSTETLTLAERRRAAGLCTACGYDLRATPDRCPECGRAVDDSSVSPEHRHP